MDQWVGDTIQGILGAPPLQLPIVKDKKKKSSQMWPKTHTQVHFISYAHLFQAFVCATIDQGNVHVRVSEMAGTFK
jgi:hypothetical protein